MSYARQHACFCRCGRRRVAGLRVQGMRRTVRRSSIHDRSEDSRTGRTEAGACLHRVRGDRGLRATYSAHLRGLLVSQRCGRKCYPVVTRSQSRRVLFGKGEMLCRFGTEGSEVQILSPRPFFLRRLARRLFLACPGWNRVLDNHHTPSIIAPASADFRFS